MCGAGTLPLEACAIALRPRPRPRRSFAFERWPSFDFRYLAAERAAATARIRAAPVAPIHASDRSAAALGVVSRNAARAIC